MFGLSFLVLLAAGVGVVLTGAVVLVLLFAIKK